MGDPAKPLEAGELLAELKLLGEENPGEVAQLRESFRRLWAEPVTPESVAIIREIQAFLGEPWAKPERLRRLRELLERYERAVQEMNALRQGLLGDEAEEAGDLAALTQRPSSVLEALWDNDADAIYDEP